MNLRNGTKWCTFVYIFRYVIFHCMQFTVLFLWLFISFHRMKEIIIIINIYNKERTEERKWKKKNCLRRNDTNEIETTCLRWVPRFLHSHHILVPFFRSFISLVCSFFLFICSQCVQRHTHTKTIFNWQTKINRVRGGAGAAATGTVVAEAAYDIQFHFIFWRKNIAKPSLVCHSYSMFEFVDIIAHKNIWKIVIVQKLMC